MRGKPGEGAVGTPGRGQRHVNHDEKRTVKHLQGIELLLALEAVHEEGDVVAGLHADGPGAGLRVEVVAGVTRAQDDPRGLRADLIGRALG